MATTSTSIKNYDDLLHEIVRLKMVEAVQSISLRKRFSSRAAIIETAMSLFPKSATIDGMRSTSLFSQDFVGLASRFLLPFLLNKTIFRRSNFLVKMFVGLLAQKASKHINEKTVTGSWNKLTTLFGKREKTVEVVI